MKKRRKLGHNNGNLLLTVDEKIVAGFESDEDIFDVSTYWLASVGVKKVRIHLGMFNSKERIVIRRN